MRYTFTLIRTFFFIFAVLLIYFFTESVYFKSIGDPSFFIDSMKNFGAVIIRILPFIIILASLLYFSSVSAVNSKPFMITMVPILTVLNTLLLLLSLMTSADFRLFDPDTRIYYYPDLGVDSINSIGDYKIALTGNASKGILFYNNAFIFNDLKIIKDEISINTSLVVGNSAVGPSYNNFMIPYRTPALKLQETGISAYILNYIFNLGINLENAFLSTAAGTGLPALIISFLFIYLGFFALACGLSVFFGDRQTILLSWSVLFAGSVLLFAALPHYLTLVSIIKSGIKNDQFRLILPAVFVGIPGGLAGYLLISMKAENSLKKTGR